MLPFLNQTQRNEIIDFQNLNPKLQFKENSFQTHFLHSSQLTDPLFFQKLLTYLFPHLLRNKPCNLYLPYAVSLFYQTTIVYFILWVCVYIGPPRRVPDEQRLMEKLLNNYEPASRPVFNASHAVIVKFGLTLTQISDMVSRQRVRRRKDCWWSIVKCYLHCACACCVKK